MSEADMDLKTEGEAPEARIAALKALLVVEESGEDLFRGSPKPGGIGRVFGGQVIAQALVAAGRSIEDDRLPHSLHAYFLRGGEEEVPIMYRVARDFDGGSFSNRRVVAFQHGQPILNLAASFQAAEAGLSHQAAMPDMPPPEALPDEATQRLAIADQVPERMRAWFLRPGPFEIRTADTPWLSGDPGPPVQRLWFRAVAPVGDDPLIHRAMIAYVSDMYLLGTSTRPHGVDWRRDRMQTASLDHSVWLHDAVSVDDWLLYATESPWSGGGRGFARGSIYTRDGRLVASVAQEGLIRRRNPR